MDSATRSARARAASSSATCPAWRYPIVGTKAMRSPRARAAAAQADMSAGFAITWEGAALALMTALARGSLRDVDVVGARLRDGGSGDGCGPRLAAHAAGRIRLHFPADRQHEGDRAREIAGHGEV